MRKRDRTYEDVKYQFSQAELLDLGGKLAVELGNIDELEVQRTSIAASMRATINELQAAASAMAQKLRDGYELREVEVLTVLDMPMPGEKQIIRIDTGEVLRTVPMTPEERQQRLFDGDDPR